MKTEVQLLYSRCFQNLSMLAILGNAIWITYLTEAWQIMVQWCCDDSLGCRMPVHPTAKDWSLKHPLDVIPVMGWGV